MFEHEKEFESFFLIFVFKFGILHSVGKIKKYSVDFIRRMPHKRERIKERA